MYTFKAKTKYHKNWASQPNVKAESIDEIIKIIREYKETFGETIEEIMIITL